MTTTLKVHVNGDYITTVKTTNNKTGHTSSQQISGVGVPGGKEEHIHYSHPTDITMTITEQYAPQDGSSPVKAPTDETST